MEAKISHVTERTAMKCCSCHTTVVPDAETPSGYRHLIAGDCSLRKGVTRDER